MCWHSAARDEGGGTRRPTRATPGCGCRNAACNVSSSDGLVVEAAGRFSAFMAEGLWAERFMLGALYPRYLEP